MTEGLKGFEQRLATAARPIPPNDAETSDRWPLRITLPLTLLLSLACWAIVWVVIATIALGDLGAAIEMLVTAPASFVAHWQT